MAKQRRGRLARKLNKLIEGTLGEANVDSWYEPINGPCMEMAGYAGGWYYVSDDKSCQEPLGYNYAEAVGHVLLKQRLRKLGCYA